MIDADVDIFRTSTMALYLIRLEMDTVLLGSGIVSPALWELSVTLGNGYGVVWVRESYHSYSIKLWRSKNIGETSCRLNRRPISKFYKVK